MLDIKLCNTNPHVISVQNNKASSSSNMQCCSTKGIFRSIHLKVYVVDMILELVITRALELREKYPRTINYKFTN